MANPINLVFLTFAVLYEGGGFIVGRYFLTRTANLESRIARRDDETEALKIRRASGRAVTSAIGENKTATLLGE